MFGRAESWVGLQACVMQQALYVTQKQQDKYNVQWWAQLWPICLFSLKGHWIPSLWRIISGDLILSSSG